MRTTLAATGALVGTVGAAFGAATLVLMPPSAAASSPTPVTAGAAGAGCGGVGVLIEPREQEGETRSTCVTEAGPDATAEEVLVGAEIDLTYVQRFPGAVCRVDGVPADQACAVMPPGDAYWGLFWSDGASGDWIYSTSALGALSVPEGGSVAFVWQDSEELVEPAVSPAGGGATPAAEPGQTRDEQVDPTDATAGWIAPALIAVLFAVAGAVVVARHRSATP